MSRVVHGADRGETAASADSTAFRFAMYAAAATAATTAVAFTFAMIAVPIAGANCTADCVGYADVDTVARFPRDYLWMYFALGLLLAYLCLMVSLRAVAPRDRTVFGQVAVAMATAATAVLASNYFVQASVVPASVAAGETEGIALLTMYNPHGLFIALEEIGYLLMGVSFLFAMPLITGSGAMARIVRWVFAAGFAVPLVALIGYSIAFGLDRQDRFEVVVIAATWLALIVNGILLTLIFRQFATSGDLRPRKADAPS